MTPVGIRRVPRIGRDSRMTDRANEIIQTYNGHVEAAERETQLARDVITDIIEKLRVLLDDKDRCLGGELGQNEWRLGHADSNTAMGRYHRLLAAARDIKRISWYNDEYTLGMEEDANDGDMLVIHGWKEYSHEWDDCEVRIPAGLLGMTRPEVDALYDEAARKALTALRTEGRTS